MHGLRLRFTSIRAVPKVIVYHHAYLLGEKPSEEVRVAPAPGLRLVFRASVPSLEKVEEKIKIEEKAKEAAPSQVSAQATS